jgi:hypothetical protein
MYYSSTTDHADTCSQARFYISMVRIAVFLYGVDGIGVLAIWLVRNLLYM